MKTTLLLALAVYLFVGAMWSLKTARSMRYQTASLPKSLLLGMCLLETLFWPVGMTGMALIKRKQRKQGRLLVPIFRD